MVIFENVVIPVIVFFVWVALMWLIVYLVREFITWFYKINEVIERLDRIEKKLYSDEVTKDDGN